MQDPEKEEQQPEPKQYEYRDLIKFEAQDNYTSFGKMKLSEKQSAPKYGFGTASRNKQQKVFVNKQLAKTSFWGKNSPGPAYEVRGTDTFTYKNNPKWKMGSEPRNTLGTGPKHDFYNRLDIDFNPDVADKVRRDDAPAYTISLESRFPNEPKRHKATPGPQYNPSHRQDVKSQPKYSFGFRRQIQGASPLVANSSTPGVVGPGSYIQKNVPKTSKIEDEPHWSFGKEPKGSIQNPGWDKYQTYDTKTRAIGVQHKSQKKTLPAYSFGKQKRDIKTGTFKDHMSTQQTSIRIQMPKY